MRLLVLAGSLVLIACSSAPVASTESPSRTTIDWTQLIAALPERVETEEVAQQIRADLVLYEDEEGLREWDKMQPRLQELLTEAYRQLVYEEAQHYARTVGIAYSVAATGKPHSDAPTWTTAAIWSYLQNRPIARRQARWEQRAATIWQTLQAETAAVAPPDPRTADLRSLRARLPGTWTFVYFKEARRQIYRPATLPRSYMRYLEDGTYQHTSEEGQKSKGNWLLTQRSGGDRAYELTLNPSVPIYGGWGYITIAGDSLIIDNSYVDGGRQVFHRVKQ